MIAARRATFAGRWPHDSKKGWLCKVTKVSSSSLVMDGLFIELETDSVFPRWWKRVGIIVQPPIRMTWYLARIVVFP
jgi:hypothetical protein